MATYCLDKENIYHLAMFLYGMNVQDLIDPKTWYTISIYTYNTHKMYKCYEMMVKQ